MWQIARAPQGARAELASGAGELLEATARNIMLISGAFYAACAIVLAGSAPTALMVRGLATVAVLGLTFALAYRLLWRHYLAAQIVWQAGLVAGIAVALLLLREPQIALLYGLLPLIAVVTLGRPAGLLAEALVLGLAVWAARLTSMPPLSATWALATVVFGAFAGLLGWAITNPLLTVAEWSLFHFDQARQNLEEAREQRLELKQAQEDLSLANRELARLSDRLQALQRIAEEARQAKAEFVANVSHELRTPLNMIIGFTEVIAQSPRTYGRLPATLLTDIAAIQRNSRHLLSLVNDVLDLSQVEAGRMALSKEWTSLAEVVQAALSVVQGLFDSKGLYLRAEVAVDLPQVYCDQTRIRQVLINLLSNAGRFTESGGVELTCRVEKEEVIIGVADSGPGIAEEDQKKVFEPFQQLDASLRRRYGGTGLGLAISRQFVEMHGGRMWLESRPGLGTTFAFSLPTAVAPAPAPAGPAADPRRSLTPDDPYGYRLRTRRSRAPAARALPRLVIVEEERALQPLLRRYMPETEVVAVAGLPEAVRELGRSPTRALILNLPPAQNIPATELSGLPYGTPALRCWVPGEGEAARRLGVAQYLIKPVTSEKLLEALRALGEGVERVLLVDDEADELHLFARMLALGERRYHVLQVTSGQRALSMLRSRRPDVMLLDLMMPGMDGFQVLEEKRQDPAIRDIPVIIVSSRDPAGQPVISNTLTLTHGPGLSVQSLAACIQAIGEVLVPG